MIDDLENHMVLNSPDAPWNDPGETEAEERARIAREEEEAAEALVAERRALLDSLMDGDILVAKHGNGIRTLYVIRRVRGQLGCCGRCLVIIHPVTSVDIGTDTQLNEDQTPYAMTIGVSQGWDYLTQFELTVLRAADGEGVRI